MFNKYTLSLTFLLSILAVASHPAACQKPEVKAFRHQQRADRYFDSFSFVDAIRMYEKVLKYDSTSNWAKLRLAESFVKLNDSEKAQHWFEQVDPAYLKKMPAELTEFASVLVKNQKYDSAQYLLQNYLANGEASIVLEEDLNRLLRDSTKFIIKPVPFNSEATDFGAAFYNNGIVFASARKPKGPVKYVYNWDYSSYLELYYMPFSGEGEAQVLKFSSKINTRYHEGPAVFYNADKSVIFTRNNFQKGASTLSDDGINKLQLFHANFDEKSGEWTTPQKLNLVGDNFSAAHPTVSPDGSVMYFASDLPGGYGKSDIYKTEYINGQWTTPVNLGPTINSARNEVFPFLAKDDLLYFASDGHGGLGGLDIYRAVFLPAGEVAIENLGYPVNTSKDDFSLVVSGRRGFFSSNRAGGVGSDDLYEILMNFVVVEPVLVAESGSIVEGAITVVDKTTGGNVSLFQSGSQFVFEAVNDHQYEIAGQAAGYSPVKVDFSSGGITFSNTPYLFKIPLKREPRFFFAGSVTPEGSTEPLPSRIEFESDKLSYTFNTLPDGKFMIQLPDSGNYMIHVKAQGYFSEADSFLVATNKKDFYLEKAYRLRKIEAGVKIKLEHVYFATNKTEVLPSSFKELDEVLSFLNENPAVKIEIGGHTDDKGSDSYNRRLSQGRAESVQKYLESHGIVAGRIVAMGYGESQPEVPNTSDENRQTNRRVEFKILDK